VIWQINTTAAREVANYELDLVQVQMVNMSQDTAVGIVTGYELDD
jgi:hypothetical protein